MNSPIASEMVLVHKTLWKKGQAELGHNRRLMLNVILVLVLNILNRIELLSEVALKVVQILPSKLITLGRFLVGQAYRFIFPRKLVDPSY